MVGRARLCLAVLVTLSALPALAQAPARDTVPSTGTAVIRGRVIAAAGQRALAKVEVRAVAGAQRVNTVVLTDANGRYEIAALPAGRYIVSVNKPNYVRASYGERRPLGPGSPIEVAAGQVVTRIDFSLQRTAVIAGRILDEFGDPAAGVQVMPMRSMYVNGERRLQPSGAMASTNDLGEYRLFGLVPGQYFVSATLRTGMFGADTTERTAYLPTLYPGTGNPAQAQRLTLVPGQTVTGINLSLLPVTSSKISGIALDVNGKPMTGGGVNVINRTMVGNSAGYGQVRPDGTFTVSGLPPGDYMLRVSTPFAQDELAAADVTVSGGDVTDVQLVAVKPSTIRGRIVFDGQDAKLPAASSVRINGMHPLASAMAVMPGNAIPKDDWTFEMKTSAGRTIVRGGVSAPGDWRLDRVLAADGADVTDTGVDVPVNGTIDVAFVMTTRHNEITGHVIDEAGGPVKDCMVVVFAQDPQRWTPGMRHLGISRPDAEGVFHLRVPPGDYLAAAFEQTEPSGPSYNDPDILQQLREHAQPFSIGATEKKTLDVRLGPPPVY
ncbi:MAG TPA: carboxypeptidase-like regulatory domain-containing protein [Vicinamibacterales bacterium]|nr:carboxypeptidase-like regulatory domain-containing protein [Vicinamibacterales bacterium]